MNDTRAKFSNVLLHLLETMEIEQITITLLVSQCGVSRQSFYYHFSDINALLQYTLEDSISVATSNKDETSFDDIIEWLGDNQQLLNQVRSVFTKDRLSGLIMPIVGTRVSAIINSAGNGDRKKFNKAFLLDFYTLGITEFLLLNLVDTRENRNAVSDFSRQIKAMILAAL